MLSGAETFAAAPGIAKEGLAVICSAFRLNAPAGDPFLWGTCILQDIDPPDFATWMREHYRLVLSQSRRMLGVTEDAEDVTQAVFVKTWKAWDGFEGNAAQRRAWLLRITRNATGGRRPQAEPASHGATRRHAGGANVGSLGFPRF